MSRLIDIDDSRNCYIGMDGEYETWNIDPNVIAEAQPQRKTGKWIQFPNHMAYKCSECGRVIQTTNGQRNVSKHYPFCHCGADMRGDQNELN